MSKQECLSSIDSQHDRMVSIVEQWAAINSGTFHHAGVERMAQAVLPEFSKFGTTPQLVEVPPLKEVNDRGVEVEHRLGPILNLRVRPDASRRVLLAIHMDTVYGEDSSFQKVTIDSDKMHGPGAADAKGGIAVMLIALEALERFLEMTGQSDSGWEVVLNSDEEIGSPSSANFLHGSAGRNHLGLLFEPSFPNGDLAGNRKGSANFHFVVRGKSAHAGRHFDEGINAIAAAADLATRLHELNEMFHTATVNVARIDGGGPLNMVPDVAVVRCNVRYLEAKLESQIRNAFKDMITDIRRDYGVEVVTHGEFTTPPKPLTVEIKTMIEQIQQCGAELGLKLNHQPTGGVCDGNRLAASGLPNVDNLGVRGAGIHSPEEYLVLESLTERAKLTASLLIGWASGEIPWPGKSD